MAYILKVLGQVAPNATTLTTLYTVPVAASTAVSSIYICNTSTTPTTFRISVAVNGVGDALSQYLYYNILLAGNDTFVATTGLSLGAGDVIRCYATLATLSFSVYGQENT